MSKERDALLVGVDSGLTVTKAVVFDLAGRELGAHAVLARYHHPAPGWVEKDPELQWRDFADAVRGALHDAAADPARVAGVGLTAHGDGLYLLDEEGVPVRPALPSLDTRASDVVRRWRNDGTHEDILALSGEPPSARHAPAMLVWIREHEPASFARIRWVVFAKDWLRWRLTGRVATDPTEASTGFTGVRSQGYDAAVLAAYGLSEIEAWLPPVAPSTAAVGTVVPAAATATGLRAGTPVACGLHDVAASALGSGVTGPGELMIVAGTYSVNEVLADEPAVDAQWMCRNWIAPGRWMHMATSPTSAVNLEWFVRQLCPLECDRAARAGVSPYAFVDEEVANVMDAPSAVLYHPFLYGSPNGVEGTAAFLGLRADHGRGHVLRAILEGVVFSHRGHVDALRSRFATRSVRLAGGARRSRIWAQLFADGLRLPVTVTDVREHGSLGAALCAGVATGLYPTIEDAVMATVRVERLHEPDARRGEALDDAFGRYIESLTPGTVNGCSHRR